MTKNLISILLASGLVFGCRYLGSLLLKGLTKVVQLVLDAVAVIDERKYPRPHCYRAHYKCYISGVRLQYLTDLVGDSIVDRRNLVICTLYNLTHSRQGVYSQMIVQLQMPVDNI